jgi:hypothetical protein
MLIPLVLKLLCRRQQSGIHCGNADRGAYLAHACTGRGKEGLAGVLHQVPAVGHLHSPGQSTRRCQGISATTVTSHDFDLWLTGQPGLRRCGLTVRQQGDGASPLHVADQGAVAVVALPSPVVDADRLRRCKCWGPAAPDNSQQGFFADRQP